MNIKIRKAQPDEAHALSDLALRSKSHWGYSPSFLIDCKSDLTVSPEEIDDGHFYVIETNDCITGFYGFSIFEEPQMTFLFVDIQSIGQGFGNLLWNHAVETAKKNKWNSFQIVSDPNAEKFYLHKGAQRKGELASPVRKDRFLPILIYELSP